MAYNMLTYVLQPLCFPHISVFAKVPEILSLCLSADLFSLTEDHDINHNTHVFFINLSQIICCHVHAHADIFETTFSFFPFWSLTPTNLALSNPRQRSFVKMRSVKWNRWVMIANLHRVKYVSAAATLKKQFSIISLCPCCQTTAHLSIEGLGAVAQELLLAAVSRTHLRPSIKWLFSACGSV